MPSRKPGRPKRNDKAMARTKRQKQKLARIVRQDYGYEMTPDECEEKLAESLAMIRKGMAERGFTLPADDEQLRELMALSKPWAKKK